MQDVPKEFCFYLLGRNQCCSWKHGTWWLALAYVSLLSFYGEECNYRYFLCFYKHSIPLQAFSSSFPIFILLASICWENIQWLVCFKVDSFCIFVDTNFAHPILGFSTSCVMQSWSKQCIQMLFMLLVCLGFYIQVWHSEREWLAWGSGCNSLHDRGSPKVSDWGMCFSNECCKLTIVKSLKADILSISPWSEQLMKG